MTLPTRAKLNMAFLLIITLPALVAGFTLSLQVVPLLIGSWLGYNIFLLSNPDYKPYKVWEFIVAAIGLTFVLGNITKEWLDSTLIAVIMAVSLYFFIPRHNRILYAGQQSE